jgi:hypothetical protein
MAAWQRTEQGKKIARLYEQSYKRYPTSVCNTLQVNIYQAIRCEDKRYALIKDKKYKFKKIKVTLLSVIINTIIAYYKYQSNKKDFLFYDENA